MQRLKNYKDKNQVRKILIIIIVFIFHEFIYPYQSINLNWGTNYFGNTIGIKYETKVYNEYSLNFEYNFGKFNFDLNEDTDILAFVNYESENETNITIDIDGILDIYATYDRSSDSQLSWFNNFGLGFSYYYFNLIEKKKLYNQSKVYSGNKYYRGLSLLFYSKIINYKLQVLNNVSIWGAFKARIFFIDLPQYIEISNGEDSYQLTLISYDENGEGTYFPIYPELIVGISYVF